MIFREKPAKSKHHYSTGIKGGMIKNELDKWAIRLTRISAGIHRVPEEKIRKRLQEYNVNLTIEDILNYKKEEKDPMTKEDKKKLIKEAEEMHGKKDPRTKKLRKELKDIK